MSTMLKQNASIFSSKTYNFELWVFIQKAINLMIKVFKIEKILHLKSVLDYHMCFSQKLLADLTRATTHIQDDFASIIYLIDCLQVDEVWKLTLD